MNVTRCQSIGTRRPSAIVTLPFQLPQSIDTLAFVYSRSKTPGLPGTGWHGALGVP